MYLIKYKPITQTYRNKKEIYLYNVIDKKFKSGGMNSFGELQIYSN